MFSDFLTIMLSTAQTNRRFWYLKVLKVEENYNLSLWTKNSKNKHESYSTDPKNKKAKCSWGRIVSCSLGKLNKFPDLGCKMTVM